MIHYEAGAGIMNSDMNRIIRLDELKTIIGGVDRTTVKRWEDKGLFPKRVKLGNRAIGWLLKDVLEWINSKRI